MRNMEKTHVWGGRAYAEKDMHTSQRAHSRMHMHDMHTSQRAHQRHTFISTCTYKTYIHLNVHLPHIHDCMCDLAHARGFRLGHGTHAPAARGFGTVSPRNPRYF